MSEQSAFITLNMCKIRVNRREGGLYEQRTGNMLQAVRVI